MTAITLTNKSDREMVVVIEPSADEYRFSPGDIMKIGPPLYLDERQVVDLQLGVEIIIIFAPEEAEVTRNGVSIGPEIL